MLHPGRYCTRKEDHGSNRASQHFKGKQKKGAMRKMGKRASQGRKDAKKMSGIAEVKGG